MENTNDVAAILKNAGALPQGAVFEEFDPLENIPTVAVGDDWKEGVTITGYFEGTQTIASPKFKHAKDRNANGVPVNYLHVFRVAATNQKLGIWTTGELRLVCEKLNIGELVSITYKGKGTNTSGSAQHFFTYKKGRINQ